MWCEWLTAELGLPNAPNFLGKPLILTYPDPDPCAITPALPRLWDTLAGSSCCTTTTHFSPPTFLFPFLCPLFLTSNDTNIPFGFLCRT